MADNRIKEFREAARLTQQELADRAGTDKSMIGRLEKGERRLSVDWMQRLGVALGVEPHELMPERKAMGRPAATVSPPRLILQINQQVTPDQAQRIFAILNERSEAPAR